MDYNKIKKYISAARLVKFEQVCNNDPQKVLKMYQANLRLSQSFYPLLSLFEVVLRNAINEELISHFNDANWLTNQRNGFMSHPNLTYTNRRTGLSRTNTFLKSRVQKIINNNRGNVSQGRIVGDLTFGFWTELFERTHYQILQGRPIQIFSNLPAGANRNTINQKLNRIRKLRNRISHHEPIIFDTVNNQTVFTLALSEQIYTDIKDIFHWLDLDFNLWTRKINNVQFEIQRIEYVFSNYPKLKYYTKRIQVGLKHYAIKYLKTEKL